MNNDILLRKRANFIKKSFPDAAFDRHRINASIRCLNSKCSSSRNGKKKLILRIDTEQYHCWVCGLKGVGIVNFFVDLNRLMQTLRVNFLILNQGGTNSK